MSRLKEFEYANPNFLEQLYKYKLKIEELEDIEELEVITDFKTGKMDPASEVSQFERARRSKGKKDVGRKIIQKLI
jgi:hypothetical protein